MAKDREKGTSKEWHVQQDYHLDRGYAWVVLAANFAAFFICGGFLLTSGIIHTALLAKFRENVARTAWAGSIFTAALSFAAPIGSAIVDRFSCRVAVMTGSGLITVGFLLTGISPNIDFSIFSYGIVTGCGGGIVFAVLFVVNGFNFKHRLNLAMGIALSGTGCGLFVMAPVLEACKAEFGYTGLCIIAAGIAMQMIVFGALMRPSPLEIKMKQLRHSNRKRDLSLKNKYSGIIDIYKEALFNGYIILLSLSMFFFCGGIYTLFIYWPNFCIHKGFTSMQGSYALSVVGFVSIGGRLASGIVASLRYVGERIVYSGSMFVFGTALVLFFLYSKSFSGHIVLAVIVGITNGSAYVALTPLNAQGVGVKYLASATGIEFFCGGIGSILIPVISGYLIHGGVSYELVFVFCGLCLFISAGLGIGTKFVKHSYSDEAENGPREITVAPEKETLVVIDPEKIVFLTESHELVDDKNEKSHDFIT